MIFVTKPALDWQGRRQPTFVDRFHRYGLKLPRGKSRPDGQTEVELDMTPEELRTTVREMLRESIGTVRGRLD